ncbi:hypothetical protein RJ639_038174 [Escallonia herrerae]|uniref:G3BP-like protein n=1 Tax=Escallonia herrerae TaxID=1293975 RepID=A0AA88WLA2_9ASTE|nr:hypothetical protein RJ639_038174 [Escallonia herrerae]
MYLTRKELDKPDLNWEESGIVIKFYPLRYPSHSLFKLNIMQMAMHAATPAAALPSAQVVGNAFVAQYYHILHQSPELVYKFYQDSSVLSRPESDGTMTSVSTMDAINRKIQALEYKNYKAEIKTADAQESYQAGVIVLVTGCLTGKDNVRRKFSQTFFLAPQEKGYFVLNDVFRYVEESEPLETTSASVTGVIDSAPTAPLASEPEPTDVPEDPAFDPATSFEEEDLHNGAEVCDPSDNEEGSVLEEEIVDEPPINSTGMKLVKVTKMYSASASVYVPTSSLRRAPANPDKQMLVSSKPSPEPEAAPTGESAPESSNAHDEVEGHSIYVRNLPLNATGAQLEEEFKGFGAIKPGGVQVRSSKQQGYCFGFVEFELVESMLKAIEASPVTIGGRQAVVEEKRTTTRGKFFLNGHVVYYAVGRGRYPSGRGGFRNDNFRGRGNFGGRGYGRNEFRNQGEFSSWPKGPGGRGGEGYQRVDQNGNGRFGRQGGTNKTSGPA